MHNHLVIFYYFFLPVAFSVQYSFWGLYKSVYFDFNCGICFQKIYLTFALNILIQYGKEINLAQDYLSRNI